MHIEEKKEDSGSTLVKQLYNKEYANIYGKLYIEPEQWQHRNATNIKILKSLLEPGCTWLDTCCGQAWHFSMFPSVIIKTGLDISSAQLHHARQKNLDATFIEADVSTFEFNPPRQFDLVTNFWGSYSYLDDEQKIAALVKKLISWLKPGGSLYMELITPETLGAYNKIPFAQETETYTFSRSEDFTRWGHVDSAGSHLLTSPKLDFFMELLKGHFEQIDASLSVNTLIQLVAKRKLP